MDWANNPYAIEARQRAERMAVRARRAGRWNPNLVEQYLVLYEIGQRNGWPMNKITAAIVTGGYSVASVAYSMGSSAVQAISNLATKYEHGFRHDRVYSF